MIKHLPNFDKKILALFLVCLSISALTGFELINVLAIPAANSNSVVEPGSLSHICTFTVYIDGSSYLAGSGTGSGNKYSETTGVAIMNDLLGDSAVGTLCFKAGVYSFVMVSTFTLKSNVKIIADKGTNFTTNNVNVDFFTATNKNNIEITGITYKTSLGNFLAATDISNFWLHDNIIDHSTSSVAIQDTVFYGSDNIWVYNNQWIKSSGAPYFKTDGAGYTGKWHYIVNNRASYITDSPIKVGGRYSVVQGNIIDGPQGAILQGPCIEVNTAMDASIIGNICSNIRQQAIFLYCSTNENTVLNPNHILQNIVISGNTGSNITTLVDGIENSGGGDSCTGGDGIEITANTAQATVNDGIFLQGDGAGSLKRVQVSDNILNSTNNSANANNAGIRFYKIGSQQIIVKNNFILQFGSTRGIIDHCVNTGINCSTNIDIEGNQIKGSGIAVLLGPNGGGASCTSCIVTNNGGYNPVGKLANFISGAFIGVCGSGSTIVSTTVYVVCETPLIWTCTGGTVSAIVEKDNLGNQIFSVASCAALPATGIYTPIGYSITWTHTGAPTVNVFAT